MIHPTHQQHEGQPVFQVTGTVCLSDRLTPAYCGGVQVGFLREQSVTAPRARVELERDRFGGYRGAGGVRWAGD